MSQLPAIEQLAADLTAGKTSAVALTEAALARAQGAAGEDARVFTKILAEAALAQARASDLLRVANIMRSPLEDLPVSVKDCIDLTGRIVGVKRLYLASPPTNNLSGNTTGSYTNSICIPLRPSFWRISQTKGKP